MKTNFLSLRFNFADLTEDLNALTFVRSRSTAIGTTDLQKLCKYCFLENMMNQMCTFNIGHPVLLSDMSFSLLRQLLCTQNCWLQIQSIQSILFLTSSMTFLYHVIASPSDVRFVTTDLPFLTN